MLTLTAEEIFTPKALKKAFGEVSSKAVGLDGVSLELFKEDLHENIEELQGEILAMRYTPEPLKQIAIEKEDRSERPIGLSAIRDKIVQKVLANALAQYYEKHFNDKNYGFRENKDTLKAVGRCRSILQNGRIWVLRTDIDNFFETIDHNRLMAILASRIEDERIVKLVALFLSNGSFERYRYIDNTVGIHQGDPLSPLLSNIYLNPLDWYLEEQGIAFVRYVDDIAIFAYDKKSLQQAKAILEDYLHSIDLELNAHKTQMVQSVKEKFDYLGITFENWEVSIAKERLDQGIARLHRYAKEVKSFDEMVVRLGQFFQGLGNYYFKVISPEHPQVDTLKEATVLALSQRVAAEKKSGTIKTKKTFGKKLALLELPFELTNSQRKDYIDRIVTKGYAQYLATKTYKRATEKIRSKKRKYAQKYATSATLHITESGSYLGVAKNTITIKQKGKLVHQIPKTQCERIIIAAKGISLSSNLVELCASLGIAIDFIGNSYKIESPYASLYGSNHSYAKMSLLQLQIHGTPLQMKLAKAFVKGKSKNQLNYLKNLDRHHDILDGQIEKMEKLMKDTISKAGTPNELMGMEGQIAHLYWQGIALVVEDKVDFDTRVTQGAKDLLNASLNYGYAILYGRVHHHAVKAGLSVNISFLHALDHNKPTLIFDMIEEFRAFVVDRTIVAMINNQEPLKLDKEGLLDRKSRQLIAKNVLERIGSFTRHKKASKKIDTIIEEQAYMLARAIRGVTTYKPFVGRY
ncbi:CRISPR-associated endonuclease Cas1 [Sulfurovum sp.]|jgi:group II intron reverse transcriptase/maturase/CRISPR-associated endonuclease Cas1|uniref:CRISPR-associated endonuclease Cas1 n=1 Tax=Sulfurovum sp. TaxID=1969726 RepID=UPI002A36B323|nr:CRISPR-associated endonuclease Cas1 [Sulfurovum sp.]MDY0403682.1 CRISPR-associated endonuclease Cas1 [Sulfurovum sp.]